MQADRIESLKSLLRVLVYASVLLRCANVLAAAPELIEQAKKEGEAVLYTTMPVGEFQVFDQAAKEKYPFLTIRHVRINSGNQASRVMPEHKSGKMQVDVIGNSLVALRFFKEQGVFAKTDSPEISQLAKGSYDPEGYWAGITSELYITAFNSNWYTAEKAPRSFDEILDRLSSDVSRSSRDLGASLGFEPEARSSMLMIGYRAVFTEYGEQ